MPHSAWKAAISVKRRGASSEVARWMAVVMEVAFGIVRPLLSVWHVEKIAGSAGSIATRLQGAV
jgi:hypothetical protein